MPPIDYTLLLVLALWIMLASNCFVLLQPGEGLLFLGATPRLHLPSWRAAFGGRLLAWVNPLRALQPITRVQVFATVGHGTLDQLTAAKLRLRQLASGAAPLAVMSSLTLCIGLPIAILLHRNAGIVLACLLLAYGLYLAALLVGWRRRTMTGGLPPGLASAASEALFCLPYAAQLPRRASLLLLPPISLAEWLAIGEPLAAGDLNPLRARLQDYRAIADTERQGQLLDELDALITRRSGESPAGKIDA